MPDLKIITFDCNGGRLKVNFRFEGRIAAAYAFSYFEANSNDLVITPPPVGNNLNNDDDMYSLPMPSQLNKGRVIILQTSINALGQDSNYNIIIQVFQDNQIIDTHTFSGSIQAGGNTQHPMLVAKLTC